MKTLKFCSCYLIIGLLLVLTSCNSLMNTVTDEINQRYADQHPWTYEDVVKRLGNEVNRRAISEKSYVAIWASNNKDLETLKTKVKNGDKIIGIYVTFEDGIIIKEYYDYELERRVKKEYGAVIAIGAIKQEIKLADLM